MDEPKFLLVPADEDEGLTKREIFEMLGMELGYSWTKNIPREPQA